MKPILFVLLLLLSGSVFAQTAVVIAENANLRGTASSTGKVVTKLANGITVEVIKQRGAWFLVQSPHYAGWLHGDTIKLNDSLTQETIDDRSIAVPVQRSTATPRAATVYAPSETPKMTSSRTYYRGPRGGCYYVNSSGKKSYVDRSLCN